MAMTPPPDLCIPLEQRRRETVSRYPGLWKRMVGEWNADDGRDAAWLLYSANYLLRTGAARWAIDPLTLRWRVAEAAAVPSGCDLSSLAFVVLTHRHADHLDLDLLRSLRALPIRWIVPEALRRQAVDPGGLAKSNIVVATHLQPIEIDGVTVTPFPGLHYEPPGRQAAADISASVRGVPSTGYLVEWGEKRWLFPGDTRDYRAHHLPSFGPVNGLFAHVWLGRGAAREVHPPLLEAQCRFCLDLRPERVILTHLEDFGRPAADLWGLGHAAQMRTHLLNSGPEVAVETARTGDRVFL